MSEEESYNNQPPFYNKISKISSSYQSRESALRIGMLNKIVSNLESNPCSDGTAECGQNTVCVLDGEDGYEVCHKRTIFIKYFTPTLQTI